MEPFIDHNRTMHKELQISQKRIKEYKRKTINIVNLIEAKEDTKPERVLYPVPIKREQPKEEEPEVKEEQEEQQGNQLPANQEETGKEDQQGQAIQDLGGFGEEKEEGEEEEPPQNDDVDKLVPKNKLFTTSVKDQLGIKKYSDGYQFYQPAEAKTERTMDLRYIKKYHDVLKKNREDIAMLGVAHEWARKKSRVNKDMQKKLEEMKLKPSYIYSTEEPPKEEKLSLQDELKYGFTTNIRTKAKKASVDLTFSELPALGQTFNEKQIRKDRISSLKSKFAKLLNLSEQEERESAPSLCQYTSRRRNISQIMKNHSHSKERLNQLEEVTRIKEKLTRAKINLNVKVLSKGLCLPENQEYSTYQSEKQAFPNKQLPSNPFMVEVKKKKKK